MNPARRDMTLTVAVLVMGLGVAALGVELLSPLPAVKAITFELPICDQLEIGHCEYSFCIGLPHYNSTSMRCWEPVNP